MRRSTQGERGVITLWHDLASAEALDHSETYNSTVAEIEATGILQGRSAVEVLALDGIFLEAEAMGTETIQRP